MPKPTIMTFGDATCEPGMSQVAVDMNEVVAVAEATMYNEETEVKSKSDGVLALYLRNRESVIFVRADYNDVLRIWGRV